MGWNISFKQTLGWAGEQLVNAASSLLTTSADVASAFAGAGFAFYQGMNKYFNAAYGGSIEGIATLDLGSRINGTDLNMFYRLAVPVHEYKDNQSLYNLSSFVDANTVLLASCILTGTGVILKIAGNALKQQQQYYYDAKKEELYSYGLLKPSKHEIMIGAAESISASLCIAMYSHTVVSCFLYYSKQLGSELYMSYPFEGDRNDSNTTYTGPLDEKNIYLNKSWPPRLEEVLLPIIGNASVWLNVSIDFMGAIAYGGEVSFDKNGSSTVAPVVTQSATALGGTIAYCLSQSFFQEKQRLRDQRLCGEEGYRPLNQGSINLNL